MTEEQKLREALIHNLSSNNRAVRSDAQTLLNWLDDDNECDSLMIATLDYCATGEGRTIRVDAFSMHSKRAFVLEILDRWRGHYFVIGAELFESTVPASLNSLLSANTIAFLQDQSTQLTSNFDISLSLHENNS